MTSAGFTTGSTGTAKDLDNSIASSLVNLSAHLSSRFFKSSDEGLLLVQGFFLLDLGEGLGETLLFFFFPAGVVSGLTLAFSPSTLPKTLTCEGSTRVGVGEDETIFFSLFFPSLYVGVASCWTCSGVKGFTNRAVFLENTVVFANPLVPTSCTFQTAIKNNHYVATRASLLSWGRHDDQYFSRNT